MTEDEAREVRRLRRELADLKRALADLKRTLLIHLHGQGERLTAVHQLIDPVAAEKWEASEWEKRMAALEDDERPTGDTRPP